MVALTGLYKKWGIPVFFYDRISCGRSTHLPSAYTARQPIGLKKIVLSSAPASMPLYKEAHKRRLAKLPLKLSVEGCRSGFYKNFRKVTLTSTRLALWEPRRLKLRRRHYLLNRRYDKVIDFVVETWFKVIKKVKWATLEKASHTLIWEDQPRFIQLCSDFLSGK
ncbi:hypothetical protein RRF57_005606 [Xylaria bambusicola]|uniref:Alpha/beta hydrolase n=1 Tax=Xylaria bambusicola TaxID=326684 RepID=A0AAN7UQS1_9PEZI